MRGDEFMDREHAAQRLEGAEAESLALVLDPDLAHPQPGRQRGQRQKRRRPMTVAQQRTHVGYPRGIDDGALRRAKRPRTRGAGVFGKPGRNHIAS